MQVVIWFVISSALAVIISAISDSNILYSNHFVVKVKGGRNVAQNIAKTHELRLLPTELNDDHFHFLESRQPKISNNPAWRITRALTSHPNVHWVEQQRLKFRFYRKIWTENSENDFFWNQEDYNKSKYFNIIETSMHNNNIIKTKFDDPFYPWQWYMHGRGTWLTNSHPRHLNVEQAWDEGLTGRGVTVFILDDGLQATNREIAPNYESWGGFDLSDLSRPLPSPTPRSTEDSHGTYCAAIVAAAGNNNFCGVGIAYEAKVGGVRILGAGALSDLQESLALTLWLKNGDIASASWGPRDDGKTVDGPGPLGRAAFLRGIHTGRNGLGAIYVWAVGNGGIWGDNCNLDGYASSIYTVTVSAIKYNGEPCAYSEPCACILANTPVGGPRAGSSVVVPELNGSCRKSFQGTSASAPLAAGIIALLLEVNPKLTWRDVQHLIVITSQHSGGPGWRTNGAGLQYHLKQGFGTLNAGSLVAAGRNFPSLPPQVTATFLMMRGPRLIYPQSNTTVTLLLPRSVLPINKLEHVEVTITLSHLTRGHLEMFIISPSHTESQVLTQRILDQSNFGFKSWPFMSVHFWGENPTGMWTFVIRNYSEEPGVLSNVILTLHGHKTRKKLSTES